MFVKNTMLLALALLLAGCGDLENNSQLINRETLRIIAMSPSTAETLYALGLSNEVVGVSRFTAYPPEAASKPVVGGLYDPNWEMIVALQPDLVVGLKTQTEIEGQLQALGIDFLGVSHKSINNILQSILIIGEACGAEAEAKKLFRGLEMKVGQASSLSSQEKPSDSEQAGSLSYVKNPRVLVCVGHDETMSRMYIASPGTLYDELIDRAGGINACGNARGGGYPEISPEGLAAMRPDMVIDIFPHLGENRENVSKAWKPYTDQLTIITNDYASLPGPRFIQLLNDFACIINPPDQETKTQ